MTYIPEEPPDENEQYESLDESLDELDLPGNEGGPEGARELDVDVDVDVVADETALHEIGADLDDPDRIALIEGAMDDPDGSGPYPQDADDGGSEVNRVTEE